MTIRFHILDALNELPITLKSTLDILLNQARNEICEVMPLDYIDVVIAPDHYWVIPEYGFGAVTHGKSRITIVIDPNSTRLQDSKFNQRLQSILAHEFHHVARLRAIELHETLADKLVLEGMALVLRRRDGISNTLLCHLSKSQRVKQDGDTSR
jgi:Predicted Zn-dependent protease (DUF2268)